VFGQKYNFISLAEQYCCVAGGSLL